MQGLCSWAFSRCSWVGEIPAFFHVLGSWVCLITCKNAGIVAFAVLGAFSVFLGAFWGSFGLIFLFSGGLESVWAFLGAYFPPLGSLPGPLGGLRGAFGGLLGALMRLLNAILTS